jgi:hypothetical protein
VENCSLESNREKLESPIQESPIQESPIQESPIQESPVQESPTQQREASNSGLEQGNTTTPVVNNTPAEFTWDSLPGIKSLIYSIRLDKLRMTKRAEILEDVTSAYGTKKKGVCCIGLCILIADHKYKVQLLHIPRQRIYRISL